MYIYTLQHLLITYIRNCKIFFTSNTRFAFLMDHYKLAPHVIHWSFNADMHLMMPDIMKRIFCMVLLDCESTAHTMQMIGLLIEPINFPPHIYGSATIYVRHSLSKLRFKEKTDYWFEAEENFFDDFRQVLYVCGSLVGEGTGPTIAIAQEHAARQFIKSGLLKTTKDIHDKIIQSALSPPETTGSRHSTADILNILCIPSLSMKQLKKLCTLNPTDVADENGIRCSTRCCLCTFSYKNMLMTAYVGSTNIAADRGARYRLLNMLQHNMTY